MLAVKLVRLGTTCYSGSNDDSMPVAFTCTREDRNMASSIATFRKLHNETIDGVAGQGSRLLKRGMFPRLLALNSKTRYDRSSPLVTGKRGKGSNEADRERNPPNYGMVERDYLESLLPLMHTSQKLPLYI